MQDTPTAASMASGAADTAASTALETAASTALDDAVALTDVAAAFEALHDHLQATLAQLDSR